MLRAIAKRIKQRLPPKIPLAELLGVGEVGLIKAIDSYNPTHPKATPLNTWVAFKIRNAILDAFRHKRYWEECGESLESDKRSEPSASEHHAVAAETKTLLLRMVQRLPAAERVAIRSHLRGQSLKEVAAELHLNETQAFHLRRRAQATLRARLESRGLSFRTLTSNS